MTAKDVVKDSTTSKEIAVLDLNFLGLESEDLLTETTPLDFSEILALASQIEVYEPRKKKASKKQVRKEVSYYRDHLARAASGAKKMLYFINCSGKVHLFRSKEQAELKAKALDRDVQSQRTTQYFWIVRPGQQLIAHDMIHEKIQIRLDGSILVNLRPKRNIESPRPITYSPEVVSSIRKRFPQLKPLSMAVKNKALVAYVLDCLDIGYTPSELRKLQVLLTRVFGLRLEKEVSFAVPEPRQITKKLRKRRRKSSRLIGPK